MVKVKSLTQIEANYKGAAGVAATRYAASIDGIAWQSKAQEGQALYEQRMSDPEILSRRNKGIAKVSDSAFKDAMRNKGASVIGGRMSAASGKMAQGYAPYKSALESLSLPPRSADPMQNIDARLKPVVQTMVDTKRSQ